jgi:hypothetical protein
MPASRQPYTLTADEVDALLRFHRQHAAELIARPQVSLAGKRLARVALRHHEARIAALSAAVVGTRDETAGG